MYVRLVHTDNSWVMWWHAFRKITFKQTDTHITHIQLWNQLNSVAYTYIRHDAFVPTETNYSTEKKKLLRVICSYRSDYSNLKAAEHPCIRSVEVWILVLSASHSLFNRSEAFQLNEFSKFILVWILQRKKPKLNCAVFVFASSEIC